MGRSVGSILWHYVGSWSAWAEVILVDFRVVCVLDSNKMNVDWTLSAPSGAGRTKTKPHWRLFQTTGCCQICKIRHQWSLLLSPLRYLIPDPCLHWYFNIQSLSQKLLTNVPCGVSDTWMWEFLASVSLNGLCLSFGDERLLFFLFLEKERDGDEVHYYLSGEVSRAVQHVIIMSTEAGPWDTPVTDDFLCSKYVAKPQTWEHGREKPPAWACLLWSPLWGVAFHSKTHFEFS